MRTSILISVLLIVGDVGFGQSILGFPILTQVDTTVFNLIFNTDSASVITVHASEDTTYRNAFIFLGRTVGEENHAEISMEGLRKDAQYTYRILLNGSFTPFSGTFKTIAPSESGF